MRNKKKKGTRGKIGPQPCSERGTTPHISTVQHRARRAVLISQEKMRADNQPRKSIPFPSGKYPQPTEEGEKEIERRSAGKKAGREVVTARSSSLRRWGREKGDSFAMGILCRPRRVGGGV